MSRSLKPVVFTDKDSDLLEFIEDKTFSTYVKGLIRKDMNHETEITSFKENTMVEIQQMLLRLINDKGSINKEDITEITEVKKKAISSARNFLKGM